MTNKSENAYKTIGEVAEILELKSKNKGDFSTHTIRFWETQFKQVKPKLLNSNRRYYDKKTIDILRKIILEYSKNGFIENLYGRKIFADGAHVNHFLQSTGVDISFSVFSKILEKPPFIRLGNTSNALGPK